MQQEQITSLDILNALNQEFSTSVNRIYIHSLDREVGFREIKVAEQKSLTKILVENEGKDDVIYDSMLAMIQSLCLEKDKVDFTNMTELDRIKIMIELYQGNFFKNELAFKCESCEFNDKFYLDFDEIINKLNVIRFEDVICNIEDEKRKYEFIINFPTIARMSEFMKAMVKSRRIIKKSASQKIDNTDMFDLFIKSFKVENKSVDGKIITVDCTQLNIQELEDVLQALPQTVLYGKEKGVLGRIQTDIFQKVDNLFDRPICSECGHEQKEVLGLKDFFM